VERRLDELIPLAAVLVLAAGFIHAVLIPHHFDESWLHGAFFVVVAAGQFAWGAAAFRNPSPRTLAIGAIGCCAVAAVWAVSRTVGLPLTFGDWQREAVEGADVMATVDELAAAVIVAQVLGWRSARRPTLTTNGLLGASTLVGVLIMVSLFMPMLSGHAHS